MILYLSPAFPTKRSQVELEFLRDADGTAAFSMYWLDVTRPLLEHLDAKCLLEIGADQGVHTRHLLNYCQEHDGELLIIEPLVGPALRTVVQGAERVQLHVDKSDSAIPRLDRGVDVVLLQGDLNYATVRNDLRALEELSRRLGAAFPVVLAKATSWPYARRDMYYEPARMPASACHPFAKKSMSPWSAELVRMGANSEYNNALREGGPANGVLTAIEDYMRSSALPLRLLALPSYHGLGILYLEGSAAHHFIQAKLAPPPQLSRFLETCELARINALLRGLPAPAEGPRAEGRLIRLIRGLGRRVMRFIPR